MYGTDSASSIFTRFKKYIDIMTIYIIISWCISMIWAGVIVSFQGVGDGYVIVFGTLLAPCIMAFCRAMVYFKLNDFEYHQDVKKLNRWIDKHN